MIVVLLFQPDTGRYSYFSVTIDKHERLRSLAPPRIIIVGGSSVAFGIDSPRLEAELGMPVANMGIQGALGLRYMLAEVQSELQPGDVVLLSPEYHQFYGYLDGKELLLDLLLVYPEGLRYLRSPQQVLTILEGFPISMQDMFRDKLDRLVFGERPLLDAIYSRAAFDAQGDVISHLDQPSQDVTKLSFGLGNTFDEQAIVAVREFSAVAERRGARVLFLFPAIPKTHYPKIENQAHTVCEELKKVQDVNLLMAPQDAVMPDDSFYNTVYHLNRQGRQVRTEKIIALVRRGLVAKMEPNCALTDN